MARARSDLLRHGVIFGTLVLGFVGACTLTFLFGAQLASELTSGSDRTLGSSVGGPITVLIMAFSFLVSIRYALLITFSWLDTVLREDPPPYPDGAWPRVAVIVPVYKEREAIERSLQSVDDLRYPGDYQVIVVIDGKDEQLDGTPELIRMFASERMDGKFVVLQKPNGGKASALNLGFAEAKRRGAALILCVDGDTIVSPGVLEKMAVHFQDPGIVASAGQCRVTNWIGGTGFGEHGFPFWESLQALEFNVGHGFLRRAQAYFLAVSIIPGPCGMFRVDVLDEIARDLPPFELEGQPSHPEHGPYEYDTLAEDCDLTLALLRWAWRNKKRGISYEPRATVATEGRGKLKDLYRQRYRWLRGVLSASVKHLRHWFGAIGEGRRPLDGRTVAAGCAAFGILVAALVALVVAGKLGALGAVAALACGGVAVVFVQWLRRDREPASLVLLGYMVFESIIWPPFSVMGVLIFVKLALFDPEVYPGILLAWFVSLMGLDLVSAIFAVFVEEESIALIPWIFLMKPLYVIALDTCKLVAMLDVSLSVPAVWHARYVAAESPSANGAGSPGQAGVA
ncbi:glycosyltransferase family 2 protein [bacterium]|nr:glycosyltransferase family 2 protein [bacterium]